MAIPVSDQHQPTLIGKSRGIRSRFGSLFSLKSSHVDIDSFYKRLLLWSLAAKPEDLQDGWLYLSKLADDKGLKTGRRIIETLKKDDQPVRGYLRR